MALHSARTVQECNPDIGRAIITNMPLDQAEFASRPLFDRIFFEDAVSSDAFRWKLSIEQYAPWQRVLFLDADIEARRDLTPVFRVLEHYPIAMCPRTNPCNKKGDLWGSPLADCGLVEFNSGVFAFDNSDERVADFFGRLRANYSARKEKIDQPSFMVTIYQDPTLPIAPLSVEWNATNRWSEARAFIRKFPGRIGLYHYRDPHRFCDVEASMRETIENVRIAFSEQGNLYSEGFAQWREGFLRGCRGRLRQALARINAMRRRSGEKRGS